LLILGVQQKKLQQQYNKELILTQAYNPLQSTITFEILEQYLNPVFFETGCWHGNGLLEAKQAGFRKLYSIEINEAMALWARGIIPDATILVGDSKHILKQVIDLIIYEPTTFWLDAHEGNDCSIIEELQSISQHKLCYAHTILIDDMRVFKNPKSPWITFDKLYELAKKVKQKAKIELINSKFFPEDIMVIQ
jgi:hypothetical protein